MNDGVVIRRATQDELSAILALQKAAFQSEAAIYGACAVSPLAQTDECIAAEFAEKTFLALTVGDLLVGSVRVSERDGRVMLEKIIVHPDFQNRGLGGRLIEEAERLFPDAKVFELMTGKKSAKNIHVYERHGYRIVREESKPNGLELVWMEKSE